MTRTQSITFRFLAFCILHSAFCIPSSAWALELSATATAVYAGDLTPVTATVTGGTASSLLLVYRAVGSASLQDTWNTNAMEGAGTSFSGYLPSLPGGTVLEWYVTDGDAVSATTTTTLAATPDNNRYHDGVLVANSTYGWQQVSGSNYVAQTPNGGQWKANGTLVASRAGDAGGSFVDTSIGMAYPSIGFDNLPLSADPYIMSPKLYGGVGTIDFRAKLMGNTIKTSEITLQVARTAQEPTENEWENVSVYKFGTQHGAPVGSGFPRICHVVLNDYSITYVRILRTGYNIYNTAIGAGRLAIDNICISKPAANVGIIEKLKNPGYPAADQNILMRCAVTNVCEDTPAVNRRVSVKYKYIARETDDPDSSATPWLSADMVSQGKDGGLDWYEGTIPTQRVGYVWYYYQVDYDGYAWEGVREPGGSIVNESISPAYWNAGKDTHVQPTAGARFQVRPFRSRYSRIALSATPPEASVGEMTLVGDEQWQAIVGVGGISVVSNYFLGYGYYEDDADAYEATPVMWGENNPDALSDPTLAGFLESTHDTTVTNRLVALNEENYSGFYLYRFSSNDKDAEAAQAEGGDRRYDYIVKKAVYQDFDDWTASPKYYESSLGGLPTLTYTEDFDGNAASAQAGALCTTNAWSEDVYADGDRPREDFDDEDLSDAFSSAALNTTYYFIRTGSRILADRKTSNAQAYTNKTLALNLGGQVENTKKSLPYGLEKITFRARASVDDRNFAVYMNGTEWTLPQYISATCELTERAPSKPYFSIVFLYKPSYWTGATWYELRVVQTDSADADNATVDIELWHHAADGKETPVAQKKNIRGQKLEVSRVVNLHVEKSNNDLRVRVNLGPTSTNPDNSNHADLRHAGALNGVTPSGTIGFGVFDAVPEFSAIKVGTGYNGTQTLGSTLVPGDWFAGGTVNGQNRWQISTSAITRPVPTQTIGIYAANCVGSESRAEIDELPTTATFTRTVNTLTMSDFTIDFKAWNKKFVQIRYEDGDGGVVLDDIWYYPWRAKTRYVGKKEANAGGVSYLDWTTPSQQEDWLDADLGSDGENMRDHWAVLEGWAVDSGTDNIGVRAHLERTRANTNLVQGVVSPALENGLGSLSFSYAASGGKVVYGVERSDEGNYHNWTPVAVYTNGASASGERYVKIGKYFAGRLRVRIYGSAADVANLLEKNPDCGYDPAWGWTDMSAKLIVDKLRAKDYPEDVNDNAWNAYNLLITDDAPDGQIYNNSGKSCFFNNHPTNDVYGAEEFRDDAPYLESPPLRGVGVGEIAFQYRLVPGTADAGADGHLVIKVAPSRDTPLAEWKTITNLVVSADGTAFMKFDNEKIFDEKNFVVRFYNPEVPGTPRPRIVIDNVLVTAPARASFKFEYVKLLPVQPLVGTNTIVEAKIMREIMNPKKIHIYCSYHKYGQGEQWGVENWFDPLTSDTVELESVGDKVYRTPADRGIPDTFAVDDIVEFVVWGVHEAIDLNAGDPPIRQGEETFETPAWYRTLDLLENEFVAMDQNVNKKAEGWSPYFWVFSCAPGTFFVNEINNWFSASPANDRNPPEFIEFAAPAGTDIGGWRLLVVRNSYNDMEYVAPAATKVQNASEKGWGFFVWGDEWMASPSNLIGRLDAVFPNSSRPTDKNLYFYGGVVVYRSNGMVEQAVSYGEPSYVAGSFWKPAGRKTFGSPNSLSLKSVIEGDYPVEGVSADDFEWALASTTPGGGNGDAQVFADLGGGPVVVALYDPAGNEITDADVLAWIATYGAQQADIDALQTMEEFNKEFLLNLDLTKNCEAELKITAIRILEGVVYIDVALVRTEDGTAVGTRPINGRLKLLGRADLAAGTFTALDNADVINNDFGLGNAANFEYELPGTSAPAFFRAVIE